MDDIVNPQDAELEEIVLGACLIESKAITLVAGILRPEVFYIEKNREIYAALQSMYRAGQVIDLMTVKEELTRRGKLDFIGGPYALVSITTRVASSAHLEYHARILQQKYIRREAILGFHKLLAQAADETTDIADTLADAHTLLDQLEKECGMSEHLRSMLQLMEADWFSPADIEAPTLEYVCFHNRKDYKLMKISEIPPVIFSEVMRDVDLAVSVAHAGSVDPETSHSTIEMRSVLVELTMPLFHFKNVTIKGSFAHIEGKLGKYNIHLGSGVIHQEGGAQIAVLPVHSQNRGRLFLPCVDEDPKTAEILTKIIFFAEDDKIKDPSILNQIK